MVSKKISNKILSITDDGGGGGWPKWDEMSQCDTKERETLVTEYSAGLSRQIDRRQRLP